jgi:hypothetical protein
MKKKTISMYKGLPMIDASDDLEIEVLKSDVAKSRKNDPEKCAAAVALNRVTKTDVEVHISRTYVKDKNRWIRFLTPESISREITSFDRSSVFEPGKYILKAPGPGQKLGNYKGKSFMGENKEKRRNPHHMTVNIRESAKKTKNAKS